MIAFPGGYSSCGGGGPSLKLTARLPLENRLKPKMKGLFLPTSSNNPFSGEVAVMGDIKQYKSMVMLKDFNSYSSALFGLGVILYDHFFEIQQCHWVSWSSFEVVHSFCHLREKDVKEDTRPPKTKMAMEKHHLIHLGVSKNRGTYPPKSSICS